MAHSEKVKLGGYITAEVLLTIAGIFVPFYLLSVYVPLLALQFVEPFRRGFFENDTSIAYPVKPNTVPMVAAAFFALATPLLAIGYAYRERFPKVIGTGMPMVIVQLYKLIGMVALSFGILLLILQIGKETIGSLRPNFLETCVPNTTVGSGYITNYFCTNNDPKAVKEIRMSFPSGHSACGAFGAWFTSIYIQRQRIPHSLRMLRSLVQVAVFAVGVYICLTRISDYWHRAADVIVGYLLGALSCIAIFYTPAGKSLALHGEQAAGI